MKKIFSCFIIIFTFFNALGQEKLAFYEDSLKKLGTVFTNDTIEDNRLKANYSFIQTLVTALKEKNSYSYPFSNLSSFVSIKKSDDNKFRIITWFTLSDGGECRFYGAIQMNNLQKLELYPLVDNSQNLKLVPSLTDSTLKVNQWLGAVYYHIIPVTNIKEPYYLLFGWKGKSSETSSKVIETLSFVDGKPNFGKAVLQNQPKSNSFHKRIIFDYTKEASMLLRYDKEENMIIYDHLVPLNEATGPLSVYAPDLSYDGLKFKSGKWYFIENIKVKNLPNEEDDFFIDPSKDVQNTNPVIKEH
jgi:hypothetical protein